MQPRVRETHGEKWFSPCHPPPRMCNIRNKGWWSRAGRAKLQTQPRWDGENLSCPTKVLCTPSGWRTPPRALVPPQNSPRRRQSRAMTDRAVPPQPQGRRAAVLHGDEGEENLPGRVCTLRPCPQGIFCGLGRGEAARRWPGGTAQQQLALASPSGVEITAPGEKPVARSWKLLGPLCWASQPRRVV